MSTLAIAEKQVQLYCYHVAEVEQWKAIVPSQPELAVVAASRELALQEIEKQLGQVMARGEVVTFLVKDAEPKKALEELSLDELEELLRARGFTGLGVFKDDPEALVMFDEIERQRDQDILLPLNGNG